MNGLTRYVLHQLTMGLVLVTLALVCVMWLSQSLRFVEMIVNRGLSVGGFLYLTALLLPNLLSIILPIALFIAVAFVYGKLIADRELVVMRAAGMSQQELMRPALIVAAFVAIVLFALNVDVLPRSYTAFKELQWTIRHTFSHVLLREGMFTLVRPGITVYVRERTTDEQLHGVLVHDERRLGKPSTLMAARGAMVNAGDGSRIVLFDGNRQEMDAETHQLSILYFDRYTFDIEPAQGTTDARFREPRERSLPDLFSTANDPNLPLRDRGRFWVEGHKRLAQPFSAFGYALIALACLISGPFSRRAQTKRIMLAATLMIATQASAMGIEGYVVKRPSFAPLIYLHTIAPIILGYWYAVRTPRRRRAALAAA
jgi:lipopolysaccharide export system permease protein